MRSAGDKINVLGAAKVTVEHKEQSCDGLMLNVCEIDGPALMGRDWLAHVKLDWASIFQVSQNKDPHDQAVRGLVSEFSEVFSGELGTLKGIEVKLRLKEGAKPKFCKPRPVPLALQETVTKEIERLVDLGILCKISSSDFASPVVAVRKPDQTVRLCGDYSVTVNPFLEVPEHPMPVPDELFSKLNGGQKFSKLDLSNAYQQCKLHPESRKLVAINTHLGLFEYTRMPYGISPAAQVFQEVMDKVLEGIDCGCFLDDIIVTGRNDEEHLANLRKVLERLREYGLRLKVKKCSFLQPSLDYLGMRVSKDGLRVDKATHKAVGKAPHPTSKPELQSFLGMVNHYRQFIPNMSMICAPLNNLLKKGARWFWSKKCKRAFRRIQAELLSDRVLTHYSLDRELFLAVDASPTGLGAVLYHDIDGCERPVSFASRSLNPAERNYSQLEREALAIVYGVKKFHKFLFGRQFVMQTDNQPLSFILNPKSGIPKVAAARIQRWAIQLAAYNFDLKHVRAGQNCVADALSRLPLAEMDSPRDMVCAVREATHLNIQSIESLPVSSKAVALATSRDPILSRVVKFLQVGWSHESDVPGELSVYFRRKAELSLEGGCVLWGTRVIVPGVLRQRVLSQLHDCHPGVVRMKSLARLHVWWPGMDSEIESLVTSCPTCQSRQPGLPSVTGTWCWPGGPWQRIHVDFAVNFMGWNYLVVVDAFSKWPEVVMMKSTTAERTVEVMREIFSRQGIPRELVSDNGPQFASHEFAAFMKSNGIKHTFSAPFHPQSNGEAENFVKTVKAGLKSFKSGSVETNLARFLMSYRVTPHTTTKRTPSELLMGRNILSKYDLICPDLRGQIQQRSGGKFEPRVVEVGEKVLAKDYRGKPGWSQGVVVGRLGSRTYLVETTEGLMWKRHIDQLRFLKDSDANGDDVLPKESCEPAHMIQIGRAHV